MIPPAAGKGKRGEGPLSTGAVGHAQPALRLGAARAAPARRVCTAVWCTPGLSHRHVAYVACADQTAICTPYGYGCLGSAARKGSTSSTKPKAIATRHSPISLHSAKSCAALSAIPSAVRGPRYSVASLVSAGCGRFSGGSAFSGGGAWTKPLVGKKL